MILRLYNLAYKKSEDINDKSVLIGITKHECESN